MPIKEEITLEDIIAKQQDNKASRLAKNTENIAKIQERAAAASGEEKARLVSLLKSHQAYTAEIEAIDPVTIATERFNKLKSE